MAVAKRLRRLAGEPCSDGGGDMAPLLLGGGCDAGHRISVCVCDADGVADCEDIGMTRHGQIRRNLQSSGAVGWSVQPFGGAGGAHARGPDQGSRMQGLAAEHDAIG